MRYLGCTKWSDIIREEPYKLKDAYVSTPNETGTEIDLNKENIKLYEYK